MTDASAATLLLESLTTKAGSSTNLSSIPPPTLEPLMAPAVSVGGSSNEKNKPAEHENSSSSLADGMDALSLANSNEADAGKRSAAEKTDVEPSADGGAVSEPMPELPRRVSRKFAEADFDSLHEEDDVAVSEEEQEATAVEHAASSEDKPQLTLIGHRIAFFDGRAPEVLEGEEKYMYHKTHCTPKVLGGTTQQESIQFKIAGGPVKGLKVLKKTYKGALGPFKEVTELGDYEPGEHEFAFDAAEIPNGMMSRGNFKTDVVYSDASGRALWKATTHFSIVKGNSKVDRACDCYKGGSK